VPEPASTPAEVVSGISIVDATESFLASRRNRGIEASTLVKYGTFVNQLRAYSESRGYVELTQLTVTDMDRFYASWKDGKRSRAKKLERLKGFLKFALKRKWITENIAEDLEAPEGSSMPANKTPFSDAELTRIYAACDAIGGATAPGPGHREWGGEDVKDFIMLSIYTGMRISDVSTFNIAERLNGNDVFLRMHKTKKELYTWIPDWLVERLRAREHKHGPLIFRYGAATTINVNYILFSCLPAPSIRPDSRARACHWSMNRFMLVMALAFGLVHAGRASNFPVAVETNRVHTAVGAFGCTITGATVATPSVLTCAAAHNLITGDQVQITGIVGTTTDNTLAYALVLSPTTFSIYADATTSTTPIAGVGTYTSGGKVSEAADISQFVTGSDFTAYITISGASTGRSDVCLQDSVDGFVNDILTLLCVDVSTPVNAGTADDYSFRAYQVPSLRAGVLNARLRVSVISQDPSTSVTVSAALR
jgi:integrase